MGQNVTVEYHWLEIEEHGNTNSLGHQLMQERQTLGRQLVGLSSKAPTSAQLVELVL
jgi:hypothetical protein